MKNLVGYLFLGTLICIALSSCQSEPQLEQNDETLFQYSALDSLLEGVYDGELTFAELSEHGDFGLGTFNALDGEMVQIDNQIYQIKADGVAYQVNEEMKTPFAVVTYFEPDQTITIDEAMACGELYEYLDSQLPTENIPFAIKIDGNFNYMKTRSVPLQEKPYPRLVDVIAEQPTFEFNNINGVMVGFRLPSYMAGANAPGYHFHFITEERDAGGHVLECQPQNIEVEIDHTGEWTTVLPEDDAFYDVELAGDEN